jgi:hypothetical protein
VQAPEGAWREGLFLVELLVPCILPAVRNAARPDAAYFVIMILQFRVYYRRYLSLDP